MCIQEEVRIKKAQGDSIHHVQQRKRKGFSMELDVPRTYADIVREKDTA